MSTRESKQYYVNQASWSGVRLKYTVPTGKIAVLLFALIQNWGPTCDVGMGIHTGSTTNISVVFWNGLAYSLTTRFGGYAVATAGQSFYAYRSNSGIADVAMFGYEITP